MPRRNRKRIVKGSNYDPVMLQMAELMSEELGEHLAEPTARADFTRAVVHRLLSRLDLPQDLVPDEVIEFRAILTEESDRGCALMAASFIDASLARLLRALFVDDPKSADDLLEGHGGLATFSSRIDAAYLLGLISPLVRRDLDLIRKIRNEFAHNAGPISFDEPRIAQFCKELRHDIFQERSLTPRKRFARVVMGVIAAIHGETKMRKRLEPCPEVLIDTLTSRTSATKVRELLNQAFAEELVSRRGK